MTKEFLGDLVTKCLHHFHGTRGKRLELDKGKDFGQQLMGIWNLKHFYNMNGVLKVTGAVYCSQENLILKKKKF